MHGAPFDFSFSGLKTAAVNLVHNTAQKGETVDRAALAAGVCQAVADSIVPRVIEAALHRGRKTVAAAGGVAANSVLRAQLERACRENGLSLCLPPLRLCGDNGSMVAAQAYYEYLAGNIGTSAQNCYATLPASELLTQQV